ncbi:MAG: tetratricopeptide repeat protein [Massilia sp.]
MHVHQLRLPPSIHFGKPTLLPEIKLLLVSHRKLAAILFLSLLASRAVATDFPFEYVDSVIARVGEHAKRYPPHFDSEEQKAEMVKSLKEVLGALDKAPNKVHGDKEILFRYAFLNSMGHNLDIPGCGNKAIEGYLRLLEFDPNDKRANYNFGSFLVGTKHIAKSIPFLQKAIDLGEKEAHYSLAFAYLSEKRNDEALAELKKYLEFDPQNETARRLVSKIEGGQAAFEFQFIKSQP